MCDSADPVSTWASDRKKTIKELQHLGKKMGELAKTREFASKSDVAAGIGTADCYLAAPVTFGATLVPAVALSGVAGTALGTSIVSYFIEKGFIEDAQKAVDKDRKSFNTLKKAVYKAEDISLAGGIENCVCVWKLVFAGDKLGTYVARKLDVSERVAASLIMLGQTTHFTSAKALPLDISLFVKEVIDSSEGNISKAAENVLELADELEKELEDIMTDAKTQKCL